MGKKQSQDDGWEDEVPDDGGGFFGWIMALFTSILVIFGLATAPPQKKVKKQKKQPKAPKAPKPPKEEQPVKAPVFDTSLLVDDAPEETKKKKKKKKKNKAVAKTQEVEATADVEDGWDTAVTKKDKKAKKAQKAVETAAAVVAEAAWEEAPTKKSKKSAAAPAAEPAWEEAGAKKEKKPKPKGPAQPAKKSSRYPGAPAFKFVTLNKKQNKMKAKLIQFFTTHNPEKVKEFEQGSNDDLVQHYCMSANIDGMAMLNEALREKYDADLDSM